MIKFKYIKIYFKFSLFAHYNNYFFFTSKNDEKLIIITPNLPSYK
jgi:hypothetical protein